MSTNIKDLEKDIVEKNLNGIYVLYGEEKYLVNEYLRKMKKAFGELHQGINYITLDESNINTIIDDIETPSFGYPKKFILIRNSGIFKKEFKQPIKDKFKDYIKENMDIVKEMAVVVFVEETVHKFDMYKTTEKESIIVEFKELKPFEIKTRLKKICTLYEVKINDRELDYLIEIAGTNMDDLINEIRKLIEYAGKGGEIQKQDIDKLTIKSMQAIIFDLTDYLGEKKTNQALEVLDNLIYNKEPLQKIIITLYNHFKKLYLTKLALEQKRDLVESLGLKPNQTFLTTKYRKQASYFSEEEIKEILNEFIDLDYKYKTGLIDLEIGMKTILCKNC